MKEVIIVNNSSLNVNAYIDSIRFDLGIETKFAGSAHRALNLIPESGNCVVITESLIPYGIELPKEYGKERNSGTKYLLEEAKKKNPECKLILYDGNFFGLEKEDRKFDCYINFSIENSCDILIKNTAHFLGLQTAGIKK